MCYNKCKSWTPVVVIDQRQKLTKGGSCEAAIGILIVSLTLLLKYSKQAWRGIFKESSGINQRAASIISLTDTERQKLAACLPLSGFRGLGRLDGAPVLSDVSLLRSISHGQWEDDRLLRHRNDLLVRPLLAQVLLGIIKALYRLQRGTDCGHCPRSLTPEWS